MTKYLATINVPGYLPMDDDPPVFDTAREAWEHLQWERMRGEDEIPGDYSETVAELGRWADPRWPVTEHERCGTVYAPTPGYEGDHDLGLAYCVTAIDEEEED